MPRQSTAHHPAALVGRPDRVELAGRQQPRQRARIQAVGLGPRLADAGIRRTDDHDLRNMALEDPRDLPRAAGHLERHPIARVKARGEQLQALGRRLHPSRRAHLTRFRDRDLAEVAMHVQADRPSDLSHFDLLLVLEREGELAGERHRPIRARGTTGQVAGAATDNARARSPSSKTACPPTFSRKAPVPVTRP